MNVENILKVDRVEKWLYILFASLGLFAFFGIVAAVNADDATHISGIGYWPEEGE